MQDTGRLNDVNVNEPVSARAVLLPGSQLV